jgi:hypothetical protein
MQATAISTRLCPRWCRPPIDDDIVAVRNGCVGTGRVIVVSMAWR